MVYLLRPTSRRFKWDKTDGIFHATHGKKNLGIPLTAADIPLEVTMKGNFVLPDFVQSQMGSIFVTDRALEALERLAPGCCQFFPVKINAPPRMEPALMYYYLDVTARAQSIDWTRSETLKRVIPAPGGGESRALKGGADGPYAKFRLLINTDPPIWREADAEIDGIHYFNNKLDEFMNDDLWQALSAEFPGQLEAMKLGEE